MSEQVIYRYTPREGSFVTGLPQRDLTETDMAFISAFDLNTGVASGLYAPVKPDEPVKAEKATGKAEVTA